MSKQTIKNFLSCTLIISFGFFSSYCQTDTVKNITYENLTLKDLLNVKIVSVSKTPEFLFDAPLSASVLTKEDIRRAGSTSIMEALRLVPGLIVREQSNGNYDIHLRGMDNVPPNVPFDITSNTTTLVMVDSRPIYSYLKGGTFWETLPVDLNDVEKIEVIRGPAAALYGPNAVNGVINIITRQPQKEGLYLVSNSRHGSNETLITNVSAGYRSKKWSVIASGNYQGRQRSQTSYYEYYRNLWFDEPQYLLKFTGDTARNIMERSPDPALAMKKYAGNMFLNYQPSENVRINLSAGIQHSIVQKVSTENAITPLSTAASDSRYADLKARVKGFIAQVSYKEGTQTTDYDPGNTYDFNTLDANIEYNYTRGKWSLKPGLSYSNAMYDDTKHSDLINKTGIFNAKGKITTETASLRGEYKLFNNKLRLVAGVALNKFNFPDTTYLSYQFASTYKLNKKSILRLVYSHAPRSSTIFDTYVDQTVAIFPTGFKKFTSITLEGNKKIKLLTANMFEIGYRTTINSKINIDVEIFDIRGKNYNTLVHNGPYQQLRGTDTIIVLPLISTNLPLKLTQQGITVSFIYSMKKMQLKPFITIQKTVMKDYTRFNNTPDAIGVPYQNNPRQNNIYSGMGTKQTFQGTPTVFGGAYLNYLVTPKLNVNMNLYYYSPQTYYHFTNVMFNDGVRGIDHINAKLIVNANISYQVVKGLYFFCSGKNLLNDTSREFFKTDEVPFMLFGGMNFEF